MKIHGDAERQVTIDGRPQSPARSQQVWNHSPDGFSWGYGGSGPAQLALAILLEAGLSGRRAVAFHQRFKQQYLVALTMDQAFTLEVDVEAWVRQEADAHE
jgi:hypothetical protein